MIRQKTLLSHSQDNGRGLEQSGLTGTRKCSTQTIREKGWAERKRKRYILHTPIKTAGIQPRKIQFLPAHYR
jgi:hypothetical protein